MDGLFYDETEVNLQRIKLRNISTNGRGLINTLYNNITINGLDAKNITCYGDEGDSSLLLFDSNIASKKAEFNNININDCTSNGPIIKILGTTNEVFINNLNINNTKSYGPLIDNLSDNVIFNNLIIIIIIIIVIVVIVIYFKIINLNINDFYKFFKYIYFIKNYYSQRF